MFSLISSIIQGVVGAFLAPILSYFHDRSVKATQAVTDKEAQDGKSIEAVVAAHAVADSVAVRSDESMRSELRDDSTYGQ